jgi:hypothetical protein
MPEVNSQLAQNLPRNFQEFLEIRKKRFQASLDCLLLFPQDDRSFEKDGPRGRAGRALSFGQFAAHGFGQNGRSKLDRRPRHKGEKSASSVFSRSTKKRGALPSQAQGRSRCWWLIDFSACL